MEVTVVAVSKMLSYSFLILVLMTAALVDIGTCQGGLCPRNDCSIQATANRSRVDCWIKARQFCPFSFPSDRYPPKPENLKVNVYRAPNNLLEFNVTWQPGSNERITNLRGYEIEIKQLVSTNQVCITMKFNNTRQKLDPQTDGQLMLYTDCASGFLGGIQRNKEYSVFIQSLPVPSTNDVKTYISDESVSIGYCERPSVTVNPYQDFYLNNEVVEVKCPSNHKLIGASALECLAVTGKGNWNDTIPNCIEYQVNVDVFLNHSVLVNFTFLPDCPTGHNVRLRDLTHDTQPQKYMFYDVPGDTFMFEDLTVGSWQACVNICSLEDYCKGFDIAEPTTLPSSTTTENNEEPTTTSTTATSTPFDTPMSSPLTNAKNPLKNPKTYIYSGVGCIVGLSLIVLVVRLRSSYKKDISHTNLQDESRITELSRESSIAENNNMCMIPDVQFPDTITIASQSRIGVETGIIPSGSV